MRKKGRVVTSVLVARIPLSTYSDMLFLHVVPQAISGSWPKNVLDRKDLVLSGGLTGCAKPPFRWPYAFGEIGLLGSPDFQSSSAEHSCWMLR